MSAARTELWEVFLRPERGLAHRHVGSVQAADRDMALLYARDVYTRRREGISLWVVRSSDVCASDPDDRDCLFDSPNSKPFRQADYYEVPDELEHL